jgi:hypothetical protein
MQRPPGGAAPFRILLENDRVNLWQGSRGFGPREPISGGDDGQGNLLLRRSRDKDGLPKLKDFPKEFGGSGEVIAE